MVEKLNLQFDADARAFFEDYNSAIYLLPGNAKNIDELSTREYKKFMAFPIARATKFYVFYGAYKNAQPLLDAITPLSVAVEDNPPLQNYATLSLEKRKNDFYLWSPDAPYWYSEPEKEGTPLPFHSFFILHLEALSENSTKITIIEDKPTVMTGRKMSVDANGRITHYAIISSKPTRKDPEFLLSCIDQFITRGLPGRHWFSCRSE